jgi:hypothetical protein
VTPNHSDAQLFLLSASAGVCKGFYIYKNVRQQAVRTLWPVHINLALKQSDVCLPFVPTAIFTVPLRTDLVF